MKKVQQISYNGKMAVARGQNMFFVTERAVFKLTEKGPVLIEIAKGADMEKDILAQMEFKPLMADEIRETPVEIYKEKAFGLKKIIEGQELGL